jgi:hypothetical protein
MVARGARSDELDGRAELAADPNDLLAWTPVDAPLGTPDHTGISGLSCSGAIRNAESLRFFGSSCSMVGRACKLA